MQPYLLSRRNFVLQSASVASLSTFVFNANAESAWPLQLSPERKAALLQELERMEDRYDPEEKMVTSRVSGVGYHTTLQAGIVHPTRTSFQYAVALLDSYREKDLQRAKAILNRVIDLQDQNPDKRTYGIWSWYLEEPLEEMSPPDWNWADFCGAQLMAAWIHHRDRLGDDLAQKVKSSILHACESIRRRNVSMGYTNIAIMGTYVTLTAAEQFGIKELANYAKERLRRFRDHVFDQGSFNEYNSPTYSRVALAELSRLLFHVQDQDDRRVIQQVHDFAWEHASKRFHPPSGQWAGPHSRCYATDIRNNDSTLAFLEVATGAQKLIWDKRPLPLGLEYYRFPIECPARFIQNYKSLAQIKTVKEIFEKREQNPATGVTYLHPSYTLGTVSVGDYWNQRRAFLTYWGDQKNPRYLQVRFLHDDYDYCSALSYNWQYQNCALSVVVFATDYGDTHPSLDRVKNATIEAHDLRLRFQFGGDIQNLNISERKRGFIHLLEDENVSMMIHPVVSSFDNGIFTNSEQREGDSLFIDKVAYSGNNKEINFANMDHSFLVFAYQIAEKNQSLRSMDNITYERTVHGDIKVKWNDFLEGYMGTPFIQFHPKPATRNLHRQHLVTGIDRKGQGR